MESVLNLKRIDRNIKVACAEKEMTLDELAGKCGMLASSLYKKRAKGTWTLKDAVIISAKLEKSVEEIFLR